MPTESLFPPVDIPNVDIWTFLFERKNREYPDDRVIYRDSKTSRAYTYAQVRAASIQFGQGLKDNWDWRKGHVLALYTPNSIDVPSVIWGCHWAGGIVSPANPGYNVEELAFQLKDAGAKGIVTQKACLSTARKACRAVGLPESRIILIGDERDETGQFKHFSSMRNNSEATRYRRAKINPKTDLAFLVYSSGTTGYPKGVMLSHTNIVSNILMLVVGEAGHLSWNNGEDGSGDRALAFLPFFHIYGLTCLIHQSLYVGMTLIVMAAFDIEDFCVAVQKFRATFAYVVPPVVLLLAKHPVVEKYHLSSLRMMSSGAAPLTKELVDAVYRRLKIPIKQGYGLSETSPTTHVQPWQDWNKAIGSVGLLLPNQTAKYIRSETGEELPIGEIGELCITGPNVFQGYLNNPQGTHDAFDPSGYFKTGDVGYQDDHGNFFITDRVKELIKYKGFQVPPAELEGLLATHPLIVDVAVIGVYEEKLASEVPRAYVVLVGPGDGGQGGGREGGGWQSGSGGSTSGNWDEKMEREILEWVKERVANHKRLRGGVRFVKQIPKSASGKILRRLLKVEAEKEKEKEKEKGEVTVEFGVVKAKL
ncbi:MAG: hypothetical protein M1823_005649 [Watsoniomyces obsoletus]|nr:MAG: hypothetical protein M1823_005649 [Watsoniomyces obsoletus]